MTNAFSNREALRGLIRDAADYLELTEQAVERANRYPSDRLVVLTAFLFVNHLRDWARKDGVLPSAVKSSPFYETIREVANGTKHLVLDPKSHPDLHAAEIMKLGGFGSGPYGRGAYGEPDIFLRARRGADDEEYFYIAWIPLNEALGWWRSALGNPSHT